MPGAEPLAGLAGDLCADGSIGSRTAALRAPYSDDDTTSGHAYLTAAQVAAHVVACTRAGLQAGFHVIGDAALDAVRQGFEAAVDQLGLQAVRDGRHRLEHVEMTDDDAVADLARFGVLASVQPVFDAWWGGDAGLYAERLGPVRGPRLNRFADLRSAGVPLAFGSDTPVTPYDPWGAVRAAVHHHDPAQRLSLPDALAAHAGRLRPGQPATYAVWDLPGGRAEGWPATRPGHPRTGLPAHRRARRDGLRARRSPGMTSGRSTKLIELDPQAVRTARRLARKAGAPVVQLARTHTTVSVERALLRLAGLAGADHERVPWVNHLVDSVRDQVGIEHGVALPVWDALRRGEAEDLLVLAQKAASGLGDLPHPRGPRGDPRRDRGPGGGSGRRPAHRPAARRAGAAGPPVRRPAAAAVDLPDRRHR